MPKANALPAILSPSQSEPSRSLKTTKRKKKDRQCNEEAVAKGSARRRQRRDSISLDPVAQARRSSLYQMPKFAKTSGQLAGKKDQHHAWQAGTIAHQHLVTAQDRSMFAQLEREAKAEKEFLRNQQEPWLRAKIFAELAVYKAHVAAYAAQRFLLRMYENPAFQSTMMVFSSAEEKAQEQKQQLKRSVDECRRRHAALRVEEERLAAWEARLQAREEVRTAAGAGAGEQVWRRVAESGEGTLGCCGE